MWTNSPLSIIENELPSPENSGWKPVEGEYSIDWEDPAEMKKVEGNIKYLLRGCAYKTGCPTTRCGCKKGDICGPGCTCNNCTNHQESRDFHAGNDQADGIQTVNNSVSTSEDEAESNDEEYMETEVITDDFVYAYDIF